MRWSKAQESEPESGAGTNEQRIAWLEKLARSSQDVFKAQNGLIESQGDMLKALDERGETYAKRLKSIETLLKAQRSMIDALDTLVKALTGRGDEHTENLEAIDGLLKAQGNLIKAKDDWIEALREQVKGHHDVILELNDRVAKLEAQAAQAQVKDS